MESSSGVSIYTPFIYFAVLVTALAVFGKIYRSRQAVNLAGVEPWYPDHIPRDIYFTLRDHTSPRPSEKVLKAALLRRSAENIKRIIKTKEAKPHLTALHEAGSIGDDLLHQFTAWEKMIEMELNDCAAEANTYAENWAQTMFATASEIIQNEGLRRRVNELNEKEKAFDADLVQAKVIVA
ncbi:Sec62/63 complex, subunit Sec66 [Yarrowia lipolytica]|jgi:translocation protein SEC66|uniref:YALI0E13211p n=2 Tax=Yarrowia lipolytica TaxID=4952 RepID=Q6C620_YARLI|nr:YALI0E13211p [Yarrowia lipolytica CLIB122]AOW05356.1 hypothetical protein YALI1_E16164g [Yarrowia lipolytica]KAB8283745.1 Sec62/63 complex, subunit Sec66 [Yarrowia lipolytica]KAE8169958.1 Sec62/63 complex, subunit Sec66 [Yarrowia lipolytica]KAJ8056874.1 Sec62/63 complex, subunit Sec66 [Yarrowia lipolytica]QNQ00180.1 Translocation protein SEC66 [Yarrowia lipolytica]|eukprot:XP_503892.1 YALI0E13211p [Yarrowia lipolytica CLIB122]